MDQETQAAPSTATETTVSTDNQTFDIPRSGTPEYDEWRNTGNLPEKDKPKTEEAASSDPSKEATSEEAPESEPGKHTQESRRKPGAEARIGELTSRVKQLEKDLEDARRPKQETKADPSPAKPANYQEWRKEFRPAKWIEEYASQNPEASYEEANAAMADHLADVRDQFRNFEQQQNAQQQSLNAKVNEARARYGERFDEVLQPTLNTIVSDAGVNPNVKAMLNDSDVIADLIYTLGSDSATLAKFLSMAKSEPGKAIRYLAVVENGIIEELSKNTARNDKGQFSSEKETPAPAKRGPESAAEPPISIGNRGAGTMDESERAFQAIGRGDAKATRAWLDAENAKDLRRHRGV
jgi:hypothetical protein